MAITVQSSYTAKLSATIQLNVVSSSAIAINRYGLFLNANVSESSPHISMFPYADATFTTPNLALGDFWFETTGLKFFDGTNIVTVVSSGSTYITSSAVTSSYALKSQLNVSANSISYTSAPVGLNFVGDVIMSASAGTVDIQIQGGQPASWIWIAQNFT